MFRHIFFTTVLLFATVMATVADDMKVQLVANGDNANTYALIKEQGFGFECPDSSRSHSTIHFQHIQQTYDSVLGRNVFQFFIHATIDDDRGRSDITDRQRNEIKTYDKSPQSSIGFEGDSMVFEWMFRLPAGMLTTKKFSHIHQLKGIDNRQGTADVSLPLITLTCYSKGTRGQSLDIRYQNRMDSSSTSLESVDLAPFLGRWVKATECVRFGSEGSYSIKIVDVGNGKVLLNYVNGNLDMWRTDCAGMRPKWGIYRYIGENRSWENQLRDEELRFADFTIRKTSQSSSVYTPQLDRFSKTSVVYDLAGRPLGKLEDVTIPGLYIVEKKKVIIK